MVKNRKTKITQYYCNVLNWLPIMNAYEQRKPSYFSTPAVQLVMAFNRSLQLIEEKGIENIFKLHEDTSNEIKDNIEKLGLKIVLLFLIVVIFW